MKKTSCLSHASSLLARFPVLAALAAFSGIASAAGIQLFEQNASGLGNAYAGSAANAENASVLFYNPAAMTQLQAREISVGVAAVRPSYRFDNRASQGGAFAGAGDGGDGGNWLYAPNAYFSFALSRDWYVGLGISRPFGVDTEYSDPWLGAAQGTKLELKTININPSLAWRVSDKISVGIGANYQRLDAEYRGRASSIAGSGAATTLHLETNDSAWGWNAGALFSLSPTTRVGVSYRSRIKYTLDGDVKASGPGAGLGGATRTDLKLPDTFILSVAQNISDRWEMLGDLSWTGWSGVSRINVTRGLATQPIEANLHNSWRVALGGTYKVNDAWKTKFGIAYDRSPVRDSHYRSVLAPDFDRWWFSLGGQWKPSKETALDFGVSYIYVRNSDIRNDHSASGAGIVDGRFDDSYGIVLGAQFSAGF
ncbi:MAG: OmpP1/FadL family transporter [Betaproteobacteria bacterium]|nr:OmpP1/FadL family transporter [Betaproteobacteria bacterium]